MVRPRVSCAASVLGGKNSNENVRPAARRSEILLISEVAGYRAGHGKLCPAREVGAMANEPGWHPDPFGRYQQRYHDGARWTEHVATDGRQLVDPLGASTAIPFVTPPTALDGGAGVAGGGSDG